jgi:hypothetical protein
VRAQQATTQGRGSEDQTLALIAALTAAAVVAAGATAGKPGSDGSTGTASVFVSNPVQSLGDETLTDQKDSDAAVPMSAYYTVELTDLASEEAGAISEGFGDYWAVTVSDVVATSLGVVNHEPLPCVADWDSTSYTSTVPHCLRRVDTNLHYPSDLNGEVHHDGQIWSRALWDIRQGLGHEHADTVILTGSFNFPGTTMTDLANRTVAAALQLYGVQAAKVTKQAFVDRGIL